jgi:uncharacterized cysteine cluster protein YcgN (CxxCxxCC family)
VSGLICKGLGHRPVTEEPHKVRQSRQILGHPADKSSALTFKRGAATCMAMSFWKTKTLAEMTRKEWESLCDGCGRCCLVKLEDEDTGKIHFTDVACHLFDGQTCRCKDYRHRTKLVPDCVRLTAKNIGELGWLPKTCAYRLLDEGKELYWWHPLVSGDPETVVKAGISMRGKTVSETGVHPMDLINRIKKLKTAGRPKRGKSVRPRNTSAPG